MVGMSRRARALLLSVSVIALAWGGPVAQAQDVSAGQARQADVKRKKNKDAQQQARQGAAWETAYAQVGQPIEPPLDAITVAATKTSERTIDTLAGVSKITTGEIEQLAPSRTSDIFFSAPSVSFQERGDEPGSAIAVRGLQDFGRVAVVIDGARQNFQRTGHNANGYFYLDPAMIAEADVVRGPVANIYGSGAIGGVVSFRTKDVEDILRIGERWGVMGEGTVGTNLFRGNIATFAAGRTENVDAIVGGSYRTQDNYKHGNGVEVPNTHQETQTGLAKLTVRPADGHEVKLGFLGYDSRYDTGQPSIPNTSAYATKTNNTTATLSWKYQRPEDRIFDFKASAYFNGTDTDQTKIAGANNPITGNIGDRRSFTVNTTGLDIYNTSRFDTGPVAQAVTYGGDYFSDKVHVVDPTGASVYTTPNGRREVGGGFVQLKSNYSSWCELI
jgi:hemoglobin/transferrin/lactoferrin receptor protein